MNSEKTITNQPKINTNSSLKQFTYPIPSPITIPLPEYLDLGTCVQSTPYPGPSSSNPLSSHNTHEMSSPYKLHIRTTSPPSSKHINFNDPSNDYLIDLSPSLSMADRFPDLDDFGAGERSVPTLTIPPCPSLSLSHLPHPFTNPAPGTNTNKQLTHTLRTDPRPQPHHQLKRRFPNARACRLGGRRGAVRRRCYGGRRRRGSAG